MNIKRPNLGRIFTSPFKWFWSVFDIRDLFLFGGLGMGGYGVYLKWGLAWSMLICGGILMIVGYLMKDR